MPQPPSTSHSPQAHTPQAHTPQLAPAPVPAWALHRRLYDWVLSLAHRPWATAALALVSFAESSFFPIPPDVLQIALTLERRARAFYYAAVSTLASVLGGLAGYAIGWGLWESAQPFALKYVFSKAQFDHVTDLYKSYDVWIVFAAAFTPIPYKVFTIAGGVAGIDLVPFALASLIGRGGRFFLVAALLYWQGPRVKRLVETYFNLLTMILLVILIAGYALYTQLR